MFYLKKNVCTCFSFTRARAWRILYHHRNAIQLATSGIHRVFREIPRVRSFREPCQNSHGTASRISPRLVPSLSLAHERSLLVLVQRSGDREIYSHTPYTPTAAAFIPPLPRCHVTQSVPLSRLPSLSSAVLPRLVSRGCRPSPFPSNRNLSRFFSIVKRLDARPSRHRVLLRRPEHHSVAKSARAFIPARTGIICISRITLFGSIVKSDRHTKTVDRKSFFCWPRAKFSLPGHDPV